jgi:hypothetical protein
MKSTLVALWIAANCEDDSGPLITLGHADEIANASGASDLVAATLASIPQTGIYRESKAVRAWFAARGIKG